MHAREGWMTKEEERAWKIVPPEGPVAMPGGMSVLEQWLDGFEQECGEGSGR